MDKIRLAKLEKNFRYSLVLLENDPLRMLSEEEIDDPQLNNTRIKLLEQIENERLIHKLITKELSNDTN